jgi:hypothetical protein
MAKAKPLDGGMMNAMPMSRSTVRGSHLGNLRGQCSSHPNMKSAASPTMQERSTSSGIGAWLWSPGNTPNAMAMISVNRSRGHAKIRLDDPPSFCLSGITG